MIKSRRKKFEACSTNAGEEKCIYVIGGRRWVDNIKMDLREIGWYAMDWIDVAQDRDQWRALVNTVMNLRVPYNAGNFLSGCTIGSFSRRAQLHE
jgi:hypothetical protein